MISLTQDLSVPLTSVPVNLKCVHSGLNLQNNPILLGQTDTDISGLWVSPSSNTDQLLVSFCDTMLAGLRSHIGSTQKISVINYISHEWGIRGWQSHIHHGSLSILLLSVRNVFFIVPRGNFFLMYKMSVGFWKKRTGVDNESQVADFLDACQVVFTLVSSLTIWIPPSSLLTQELDFVNPPRSRSFWQIQTHNNQTHRDWYINRLPKQ